jgi:hypothetical protein
MTRHGLSRPAVVNVNHGSSRNSSGEHNRCSAVGAITSGKQVASRQLRCEEVGETPQAQHQSQQQSYRTLVEEKSPGAFAPAPAMTDKTHQSLNHATAPMRPASAKRGRTRHFFLESLQALALSGVVDQPSRIVSKSGHRSQLRQLLEHFRRVRMGPSAETPRLKAVRQPILQQTKRQFAFGLRKPIYTAMDGRRPMVNCFTNSLSVTSCQHTWLANNLCEAHRQSRLRLSTVYLHCSTACHNPTPTSTKRQPNVSWRTYPRRNAWRYRFCNKSTVRTTGPAAFEFQPRVIKIASPTD